MEIMFTNLTHLGTTERNSSSYMFYERFSEALAVGLLLASAAADALRPSSSPASCGG